MCVRSEEMYGGSEEMCVGSEKICVVSEEMCVRGGSECVSLLWGCEGVCMPGGIDGCEYM